MDDPVRIEADIDPHEPSGWLVIGRSAGEELLIDVNGVHIIVSLRRASRGKASLAFSAPLFVRIRRMEINKE